jgi:hypothetical protein
MRRIKPPSVSGSKKLNLLAKLAKNHGPDQRLPEPYPWAAFLAVTNVLGTIPAGSRLGAYSQPPSRTYSPFSKSWGG